MGKLKHRAALSLTAFAGAKKSTYDKAAERLKITNLNAKKVNAYRKWLAKEGIQTPKAGPRGAHTEEPEGGPAAEIEDEPKGIEDEAKGIELKGKKGLKRKSALHRLHEKKLAEKTAQEAERERWRVEQEERDSRRKAAFAKRKSHANLMRKKNTKGQPVMKHRIDSMLEKIQAGMA
mmetsp:Transcript_14464/g.27797  ORF Transcript_14464/g.27797 Transcript_14464/m.27797 type:complete len:177 (+) Transcript_14464:209-739(+)